MPVVYDSNSTQHVKKFGSSLKHGSLLYDQRLGVVSKMLLGARPGWTLSLKGKESLLLGMALERPRLFFQLSSIADIMDTPTFDLACALQADGWSCAVRARGENKAQSKDTRCEQQSVDIAYVTRHTLGAQGGEMTYTPKHPAAATQRMLG